MVFAVEVTTPIGAITIAGALVRRLLGQ